MPYFADAQLPQNVQHYIQDTDAYFEKFGIDIDNENKTQVALQDKKFETEATVYYEGKEIMTVTFDKDGNVLTTTIHNENLAKLSPSFAKLFPPGKLGTLASPDFNPNLKVSAAAILVIVLLEIIEEHSRMALDNVKAILVQMEMTTVVATIQAYHIIAAAALSAAMERFAGMTKIITGVVMTVLVVVAMWKLATDNTYEAAAKDHQSADRQADDIQRAMDNANNNAEETVLATDAFPGDSGKNIPAGHIHVAPEDMTDEVYLDNIPDDVIPPPPDPNTHVVPRGVQMKTDAEGNALNDTKSYEMQNKPIADMKNIKPEARAEYSKEYKTKALEKKAELRKINMRQEQEIRNLQQMATIANNLLSGSSDIFRSVAIRGKGDHDAAGKIYEGYAKNIQTVISLIMDDKTSIRQNLDKCLDMIVRALDAWKHNMIASLGGGR